MTHVAPGLLILLLDKAFNIDVASIDHLLREAGWLHLFDSMLGQHLPDLAIAHSLLLQALCLQLTTNSRHLALSELTHLVVCAEEGSVEVATLTQALRAADVDGGTAPVATDTCWKALKCSVL